MSVAPASTSSGFKLGADPKKLIVLVVVLAIAAFLFWRNSQDSSSPGPASAPVNVPANGGLGGSASLSLKQQQAALLEGPGNVAARPVRRRGAPVEREVFVMRPIDPSRGDIDPTLRLELLERLKTVKMAAPGRSLFEIGTAPPQSLAGGGPVKIPVGKLQQPPPVDPKPATPPVAVTPPPTPIPLKFYGFIRPANNKDLRRGFFLDGEVILVASEGETIKQRYKVVKYTETSAMMEDTTTKVQQSLPIVPEARNEN